jgi:hypothetical protein
VGSHEKVQLNKEQLSIIYGSVMGDLYLQNNGKNVRLRFEHSRDQEKYLLWKYKSLRNIFTDVSVVRIYRVHPETKRTYRYIRCQSRTLPELRSVKDVFYRNGKKIVPLDLDKYINNSISLAVWYMDDGYYYRRDKCGYLYLGNVLKKEANICCDTLKKNFNLSTRILNKKKGYALYFPRTEMYKLKKIIQNYILPLFNYKLPH